MLNVTEFDSDIVRVCGFIAGLGETEVEKKIDYDIARQIAMILTLYYKHE